MYQAKQLLLQMLDVGIFVTLASCNFFLSKIHSETIITILYNPHFNIFCFFLNINNLIIHSNKIKLIGIYIYRRYKDKKH